MVYDMGIKRSHMLKRAGSCNNRGPQTSDGFGISSEWIFVSKVDWLKL